MATQWFTTLDESRAQFGDYRVNPEKATERVLTRVFYGISKAAFPTIRDTLDSTAEINNPKVDNQTWPGVWRIKDIRTQDGQGELEGSLTVFQDIANELTDGPGEDNEYLAGLQSDAFELIEYQWMKYTHYLKRTAKKWVNLSQDAAEDAVDYLGKIRPYSDIFVGNTFKEISLTGTWKRDGATVVVSSTWGSKYWNAIVKGVLADDSVNTYWIVDTVSEPYDIVQLAPSEGETGTCTYKLKLEATEISQPFIESVRMQEESDHSFTVYRTITELTYPAIMRLLYLQYAGVTITSELPVEDTNTIKLSGFINLTEKIYKNARFRIGADTYMVTADATCVAGAVTLAVTPAVTAATVAAHTADVANSGARAFFNAIG